MNFLKLLCIPRLTRLRSETNPNSQDKSLELHHRRRMSCDHDAIKYPKDAVLSSRLNKGMCFTLEERQRLNVHGLFPICQRTIEEQLHVLWTNFQAIQSNLGRYQYLRLLRQGYERLYFRFVYEHVAEVLPIIYTPTVGTACMVYGLMCRGLSGIYLTKYDKGHMVDVLKNWPYFDSVKAVCITDGQRILGLGDLGANGMGISVGKMELYTALAGIPPEQCLPMCLDVGINNAQLRDDSIYIGLREARLTGSEYEAFVGEVVDSVIKAFGCKTLIHFEDFATPNAFMFLEKYQDKCCFFNDDIQGTAAVGLAGLLGMQRISGKDLQDHVILFVGAGSAIMGLSYLLKKELLSRGLSEEEAVKNIYVADENGLITNANENIPGFIGDFAKNMPPISSLEDIVEAIKPSIILGATSAPGIFTEKILSSMAKNHERPGVFAFSNPTNKAECTAEQAYQATEGRAIYSAGSPFPPVEYNGKRLTPGQANNCFAFPGIVLGVLTAQGIRIPDDVYLIASHTLSNFPTQKDIDSGKIYPDIIKAKEVAIDIGVNVAQWFFDNGLATLSPVPKDIRQYIHMHEYQLVFGSSLSKTWTYPKMPPNPKPKGCDQNKNK